MFFLNKRGQQKQSEQEKKIKTLHQQVQRKNEFGLSLIVKVHGIYRQSLCNIWFKIIM